MWKELIETLKFANTLFKSSYLRTPNGWVIRTLLSGYNSGAYVSQIEIEDKNHSWIPIKWENIENNVDGGTDYNSSRLEVPGGWILRNCINKTNAGVNVSQIFISDPKHSWRLES